MAKGADLPPSLTQTDIYVVEVTNLLQLIKVPPKLTYEGHNELIGIYQDQGYTHLMELNLDNTYNVCKKSRIIE